MYVGQVQELALFQGEPHTPGSCLLLVDWLYCFEVLSCLLYILTDCQYIEVISESDSD